MGRRAWMLLAVVGVMAMAAVVAVSVLMGGCAKPVETAAGGTVPMKCHWTFVATTLVGAAGVVTALLSLPLRYMHCPCEVCHMDDIENCIELLAQLLCRIDEHIDLDPFH